MTLCLSSSSQVTLDNRSLAAKELGKKENGSDTGMCHVLILLRRKHILKSYAGAVAEIQMW